MRALVSLLLLLCSVVCFSQEEQIYGTVIDAKGNPISFVNVLVYETGASGALTGTTTDEVGVFTISGLEKQEYRLEISFIGFTSKFILVSPGPNPIEGGMGGDLKTITLVEEAEILEETLLTFKKPTVKKEPGRLVFEVENTSLSSGNTLSLLTKTPGVTLIQGQIKIRFATPVIYINNKRVYLSSEEISTLLTNIDASVVKSIEVITNPSAKYDAEAGTVLNINTTKSISVGYNGNIATTYEQGILPKYNVSTAQFYKNDWLNLYGSYGFSPRKDFKKDHNDSRYFEPNGETNSVWESEFTRRTTSYAHNGTMIADIILGKYHELSVSSNVLVVPKKNFANRVDAQIFNAQQQLDSTFVTQSTLENENYNLSFSAEHSWKLNTKGTQLTTAGNYIKYNNTQYQEVSTRYFLPSGVFLRNNRFSTDANQNSHIVTAKLDLTTPALSGTLETGLKYSNIDTQSGLDFFTANTGSMVLDDSLSDVFNYQESIHAAYVNFSKNWVKWNLNLGVRTEYTDVNGTSQSLGVVNTQEYVEWFPSGSLQYKLNDDHSIGASYARRIQRPRYQSLNPFLYFLNENNFSGGNPNLVPAIETKLMLDYNFKNKLFFELYYQTFKNALGALAFQDNTNRTLRTIDSNLITDFQYSFDIVYASPIKSWWYLSLVTSSFYLENEFFAVESEPLTYSNTTFGFYGQLYSGLTLSKSAALTSDITAVYISNLIYGTYQYKNQFNLSISFRKKFWDNAASFSVGVDDIFNTYNVLVSSRYYNQDNSYFAQPESRLFRASFQYNFGNARLRDNKRATTPDETKRLQ